MPKNIIDFGSSLSDKTKKALALSFFLLAYLIILCVYVFNINSGNVSAYKSSLVVTTFAAFLPLFVAWSYDSNIFVAGIASALMITGTAFQATLSPDKNVKLIYTISIIVLIIIMAALKFYERIEKEEDARLLKAIYYASNAIILASGILLRLIVKPRNGAYCWISIGTTSLQITELLKLIFLIGLVMAYKISDSDKSIVIKTAALFIATSLSFILVNEAGTLLCCFAVWFIFMFFVIRDIKTFIKFISAVAILAGIGIAFIYVVSGFIKQPAENVSDNESILGTLEKLVLKIKYRIDAFLPGKSGDSYQVDRAISLIKIGGLFGRLSRAVNTLYAAESDMVFASLTSRFGCIISAGVILSFLFIFVSSINKKFESKNEWPILVAASSMIFAQALISICSCLKILPVVGISTPFIGEGGTNLLTNIALLVTMLWTMRDSGTKDAVILRKDDLNDDEN